LARTADSQTVEASYVNVEIGRLLLK